MDLAPTISEVTKVIDWIKSSGFEVSRVELTTRTPVENVNYVTDYYVTSKRGTLEDIVPTVSTWDYEGKCSSMLRAFREGGRFVLHILSGQGYSHHFKQHQGVGGNVDIHFKDSRNPAIIESFIRAFWDDVCFGFITFNPKFTPIVFTPKTFAESTEYFNKPTFRRCLKGSCIGCNKKVADKLFDNIYGEIAG